MRNPSLAETDLAILSQLHQSLMNTVTFAQSADISPGRLSNRLAFMVNNGLVREVGAHSTTSKEPTIPADSCGIQK